jgi:predicted membrane protein
MENQQEKAHESRSGRVMAGLVLIAVGSLIFADKAGVFVPHWIFSWQMILIAVGTYIGAHRSFRPGGWLIPIAIGAIFLVDDLWFDLADFRPYLWPTIFIAIGVYMIVRPKRSGKSFERPNDILSEDNIDSVNIFGGSKTNVISKNFKQGEVVTFFGGTEINFSQADIESTARLEIVQAFGGTKLIIPAHWNVKSEMVCILGGVNEKRAVSKDIAIGEKTLILEGTCILGGIDIKSY